MASGTVFVQLTALSRVGPSSSFATLDTRAGGSTPAEVFSVLDFDDTTIEYADFLVNLRGYDGGGLTLVLEWMATSATSGDVVWGAAIRRLGEDAEDVDTSHSYDFNDATATTTASASGETKYTTITFSDGADMDSLSEGETGLLRIRRNASSGSDTLSGDAELLRVTLRET